MLCQESVLISMHFISLQSVILVSFWATVVYIISIENNLLDNLSLLQSV